MGYDLHITRREFWSDEDGPQITREEWETYVQRDSEVTADRVNVGPNYLYVYGQQSWPLWWDESGEVYTKNPPPEVIAKLVQIASALDAHVLGDDDEIYGFDPTDPTQSVAR